MIMRPGYRHNERLLRAAMVGVSDPAEPAPAQLPHPEPASRTGRRVNAAPGGRAVPGVPHDDFGGGDAG